MKHLNSDKDLIAKTFGQMIKKEKDKVPIIDTPSAPETVNQDNLSTPINNNHRNGNVETDG
eukprot:4153735-Ditylum_brightwellii.AAC.1